MYHFSRSTSAGAKAKYVPPAARRQATNAMAADSDTARQQSDAAEKSKEERAAVRRKVRSLLNRVAVANLPRVASELADMFNAAPKDVVATSIVDSIMQVCCNWLIVPVLTIPAPANVRPAAYRALRVEAKSDARACCGKSTERSENE